MVLLNSALRLYLLVFVFNNFLEGGLNDNAVDIFLKQSYTCMFYKDDIPHLFVLTSDVL